MILGKSTDPIELKKIPLNLWPLQNEIKATLSFYHNTKPDELQKVKDYYEGKLEIDASEQNKEQSEEQNSITAINENIKNLSSEQIIAYRKAIKRIKPEIVAKGHTFLFDISIDEILIFTDQPFFIGQTLVIEFDIQQTFNVTCEVRYIKNIALKSRIIGENKPVQRIVCKFNHLQPGDRGLLKNFISKIDLRSIEDVPIKGLHAVKDSEDEQEESENEQASIDAT